MFFKDNSENEILFLTKEILAGAAPAPNILPGKRLHARMTKNLT